MGGDTVLSCFIPVISTIDRCARSTDRPMSRRNHPVSSGLVGEATVITPYVVVCANRLHKAPR